MDSKRSPSTQSSTAKTGDHGSKGAANHRLNSDGRGRGETLRDRLIPEPRGIPVLAANIRAPGTTSIARARTAVGPEQRAQPVPGLRR